MPATHTPGAVDAAAAPEAAAAAMRAEGLQPYAWQNESGYVYAPHRHAYHKVLYCTRGSIRFDLPEEGRSVELQARRPPGSRSRHRPRRRRRAGRRHLPRSPALGAHARVVPLNGLLHAVHGLR